MGVFEGVRGEGLAQPLSPMSQTMVDSIKFYEFKIAQLEEKFDSLAMINEGRENPFIIKYLREIWIQIVRFRDLLDEAKNG